MACRSWRISGARLAISSKQLNVYAVLPDLRIAAASARLQLRQFGSSSTTPIRAGFFRIPLIDTPGLVTEDKAHGLLPAKGLVEYSTCSTTR